MSELVKKMTQEMKLRNLAERTQETYLAVYEEFRRYHGFAETDFNLTDAKSFLLHLHKRGYASETIKKNVTALRFIFGPTMGRPELASALPYPRILLRQPDILSGNEVEQIFTAMVRLVPGMVLMTMYGAGLRVSEACKLKVGDIDSKRGVIHVRQGKGGKERYVMLSARLLQALRAYWQKVRPEGDYLFPGHSNGHIHPETVRITLREAVFRAGINKRVTTHVLRHTFATHLLETGADVRVIQRLLGHASIRSTERYTYVSKKHVAAVKSPLDLIGTRSGAALG